MTRAIVISRLRGDRPLPVVYPPGAERPKTRGECKDGVRPCPWASCRHHLYIDVVRDGALKLNFPHLEVDELDPSCSLDVAEQQDGATLDEVGIAMNLTRERTRQVEAVALERVLSGLGPKMREELLAHLEEVPSWVMRNVRGRG